jgi:hypothetical protein
VGDLATLLAAGGTFLTGISSLVGILVVSRRTSNTERHRAADISVKSLLEAARDGQITPEEAADLLREGEGEQ